MIEVKLLQGWILQKCRLFTNTYFPDHYLLCSKYNKDFVSALKADKKRLKAEKFDLLNQMKQLYATLEDKEKELRDFIRNYEQVCNCFSSIGENCAKE